MIRLLGWFAAAILVAGCGSKATPPQQHQGAPEWLYNPGMSGKIGGVGSARTHVGGQKCPAQAGHIQGSGRTGQPDGGQGLQRDGHLCSGLPIGGNERNGELQRPDQQRDDRQRRDQGDLVRQLPG